MLHRSIELTAQSGNQESFYIDLADIKKPVSLLAFVALERQFELRLFN